jgi:hypothetical protein
LSLKQKSSTVFPDLEKIKDLEVKQVLNDLFKVLQGFFTDSFDDASDKISKTTAGEIAAMTEKTTLADADLFLIEDSAVGNAKKKVQRNNVLGLGSSAAGDIQQSSADTARASAGASYVKIKEIVVPRSGTLRIKFDLESSGGGNTNGRIYKNGVAVGTVRTAVAAGYTTYSEDISGWTVGDLCQLYIQEAGAAGNARNFRIYEAVPIDYLVVTD